MEVILALSLWTAVLIPLDQGVLQSQMKLWRAMAKYSKGLFLIQITVWVGQRQLLSPGDDSFPQSLPLEVFQFQLRRSEAEYVWMHTHFERPYSESNTHPSAPIL